MQSVAVRELKARLSEYLALVKAGEEVIVTERGKTIAKLVPVSPDEALEERMRELEKQGLLKIGTGIPEDFWDLPRIKDPEGLALKALLEDREEGL